MSTSTDSKFALHLDEDDPWPGLAAYDEASKEFFHGRARDSAELLRLIHLSPFVALYGKSGLGKSSMLLAGLFPQLRAARFLPVHLRLDYTEKVGQSVLAQAAQRLQQEIDAAGVSAKSMDEGETLWAYLQQREWPIWTWDNYPLTPVLVFDQFEEVFSRGGSAAHIEGILDSLADLIGDRIPVGLADDHDAARRLNLKAQQYRVVVSFRSDFLAEFESWEKAANLPRRESLHLTAMSRELAIDAVSRAGRKVLAAGVDADIVDFLLKGEGTAAPGRTTEVEPVLLSLCCYQLNRRRQRPAKIDKELLRTVGEGILKGFYEEALHGMSPRVSVFIEEHLIQGNRFRSNYPLEEALANGALTQQELDHLTDSRLLRVDPEGDVPRVELIHDRLVGVVREARDARLARETLARETETRQRELEESARERERGLRDAQHAERERHLEREAAAGRKFRLVSVALAIAAILVAISAWGAFRQRRLADANAESATTAAAVADSLRQRATRSLEQITDGIRLRQAFASGDVATIDAFVKRQRTPPAVRFLATAEDRRFKDSQGRSIFRFSLHPDFTTLAKDNTALAVITYRMDHSTFRNPLYTTGPDRGFTATYEGWGCLGTVSVLIEYRDPSRPLDVVRFDQCASLTRR